MNEPKQRWTGEARVKQREAAIERGLAGKGMEASRVARRARTFKHEALAAALASLMVTRTA